MARLIAYMPTPGGVSGAPRRLLTLASALKTRGIEVCVASQSRSELLQLAERAGCETVSIDAAGILDLRQRALFGGGLWFRFRVLKDLLKQNRRLLRCIREGRGDAVWIRGSKGVAFGALGARLSGRLLIWDVDYEPPSQGAVRWLHLLGARLSEVIVFQYPAAPDVIFGQKTAARYRHKCRTIVPGIDLTALEPFRRMRVRRDRASHAAFVILQVGTICARKNQKVLLEALARMGKSRPGQAVEIWFAGSVFEDSYAEGLRTTVNAQGLQGAVRFLGWRGDVHELMANADLLAMPSRDEGVPNAVQEAMALGLPVLASDAGGMPEVVRDGETGWIVDMDWVSGWTEKIQWCVDHPNECETVGENACSYALQHFDSEKWAAKYSRVVMEVVGGDKKPTDRK